MRGTLANPTGDHGQLFLQEKCRKSLPNRPKSGETMETMENRYMMTRNALSLSMANSSVSVRLQKQNRT